MMLRQRLSHLSTRSSLGKSVMAFSVPAIGQPHGVHCKHPHRQAARSHLHTSTSLRSGAASSSASRPVLLLDVMDTIVVDPFFKQVPQFFNLSFNELLKAKHPSAWLEFETDQISEQELYRKFFLDGRKVDGDGLRQLMVDSYCYVDGMEKLLLRLKQSGIQMHAMSNYPMYFQHIETKLQLSRFLDWTFMSCVGPMKGLRKPAREAYDIAAAHLQLLPDQLVFVDDRQANVDAAKAAGWDGILFKNAADLEQQLRHRGLTF